MSDAMQDHGLGWGGGDDDILCTWQHVRCYATSWFGAGVVIIMAFSALDDMSDATRHHGLGWVGDDDNDILCT